jgi:hypothetical protein
VERLEAPAGGTNRASVRHRQRVCLRTVEHRLHMLRELLMRELVRMAKDAIAVKEDRRGRVWVDTKDFLAKRMLDYIEPTATPNDAESIEYIGLTIDYLIEYGTIPLRLSVSVRGMTQPE